MPRRHRRAAVDLEQLRGQARRLDDEARRERQDRDVEARVRTPATTTRAPAPTRGRRR